MEILNRNYWFPKMRSFVKRHLASCPECLYQKDKGGAKGIELHPIEKIPIPFHTLNVDHIGPFVRSSRKNSHVFVIIDAFTKFVFLKPVKDTSTKFVVRALNDIFVYFGVPFRIICDRAGSFTSRMFNNFCKDNDIKLVLNATATPRANGQVERINRTLLNALRTSSQFDDEYNWEKYLKSIQWSMNSISSSVTGFSPHRLMFCYAPRTILKDKLALCLSNAESFDSIENGKTIIENNRELAAQRISRHQESSKIRFDKTHKAPDMYDVGDLVMVCREPVSTGHSTKLQEKYKGPFRVEAVLHGDRYRIVDMVTEPGKRKFTGVFSSDRMKLMERPSDDDHEQLSSDGEDGN